MYLLTKTDPDKQQAFEQEIDLIKKLLNHNTVLLYQDGIHVRAYQSLHTNMVRIRQTKASAYVWTPCHCHLIWRFERND
jgi:hypothetical protein